MTPTKVSALGVEFAKTDQQSILFIIASVTAYFLVSFLVYAIADFFVWRQSIQLGMREAIRDHVDYQRDVGPEMAALSDIIMDIKHVDWKSDLPVMAVRFLLDFVLPVLLGGFALYVLIVGALSI